MADALEIGLSALKAHQRAMEVTGHNIANAASPGYSRQSVALGTPMPESVPAGMLGRGVTIEGVRRSVDELLIERLRQAQTESARLTAVSGTLSSVEAAFDEPGETGFAAAINRFFATFQDLSNNPESASMRSAVVTEMQTFPARLNGLAEDLDSLRQDLRSGMALQLDRVNALSTQAAGLNQMIAREVLVGNNPNDLLDQRERLMNELSTYVDVRVTIDPRDLTLRADLGGRLLIASDRASRLVSSTSPDGTISIAFEDGVGASISGGSIGASLELANRIIPDYRSRLDAIASSIIAGFNAAHATGVNADFRGERFTAEFPIDASLSQVNLDDPSLARDGVSGIPEAFRPTFTDANGVSQASNLAINVLDLETGVAVKHIVRYEPGTAPVPASRSLEDLVSAINTGRGGGFSLYPPSAGIPGMRASLVPVDGGLKLELAADSGKSIDFSRALDTRPAAEAWTSPTVTVTGGDAALANRRLELAVSGGTLVASYRDASGTAIPYGAPLAIPPGGAIGGLTITAAAGTYVDGERFVVDLGATGATAGVVTQAATWTAGSAAVTFAGRYTGSLAYDPARTWSMRVLSSGVVGSATAAPVVEFSYWTDADGGAVQRTLTRTLDGTAAAGHPVTIADGVHVSFGAGSLTAGDEIDLVVGGQPDGAGLLPALGINGMFSGFDAATISVSERLRLDPAQLATGHSRSAGDNANVLALLRVRDAKLMDGGASTLEAGYQRMVSDIGTGVDQAKRLSETQALVKRTLENRRSDVSGVSIDEEVGKLILEQQAYSAAARLITTARENIATLLGLLD